MIVQTYSCNVCGKLRDKDTNHWWIVFIPQFVNPNEHRIEIKTWEHSGGNSQDHQKAIHVCGDAHLNTIFQAFLDKRPIPGTDINPRPVDNEHAGDAAPYIVGKPSEHGTGAEVTIREADSPDDKCSGCGHTRSEHGASGIGCWHVIGALPKENYKHPPMCSCQQFLEPSH